MKEGMHEGTFEFGRWSGAGKDGFSLVVTDKASSLVVFQAEVDPEPLILAITGRGALPIHFRLAPASVAEKVGMVRTIRSVILGEEQSETARRIAPKSYQNPPQQEIDDFRAYVESAALVAMRNEDGDGFSPDGWRLDHDGHRSQQTKGWRVTMERFDPPTPDPAAPCPGN